MKKNNRKNQLLVGLVSLIAVLGSMCLASSVHASECGPSIREGERCTLELKNLETATVVMDVAQGKTVLVKKGPGCQIASYQTGPYFLEAGGIGADGTKLQGGNTTYKFASLNSACTLELQAQKNS